MRIVAYSYDAGFFKNFVFKFIQQKLVKISFSASREALFPLVREVGTPVA